MSLTDNAHMTFVIILSYSDFHETLPMVFSLSDMVLVRKIQSLWNFCAYVPIYRNNKAMHSIGNLVFHDMHLI